MTLGIMRNWYAAKRNFWTFWVRGHGRREPTENENGSGWHDSGGEVEKWGLGDMGTWTWSKRVDVDVDGWWRRSPVVLILDSKALDNCLHSPPGISICPPVSSFLWKNRFDLSSLIITVWRHWNCGFYIHIIPPLSLFSQLIGLYGDSRS